MNDPCVTVSGLTQDEWRRVCLTAFENLSSDTAVTMGDVDAILTWCLPDYEARRTAAGVVRVDTRDPRIREHGVAVAVDAWHAACHAGATNLEAMQLVFDAVLAALTEAQP